MDDAIQRVGIGDVNWAAPSVQLDVIFAGPLPPNPDELVESHRMRQVLRAAEDRYDLVVVDTPPTAVVSDAIPLVNEVSGVLVVGRLGKTSRDAAIHLVHQLDNLEARVLGVVVNGVPQGRGYGYGYGYTREYDAPASREVFQPSAHVGVAEAPDRDGGFSESPDRA